MTGSNVAILKRTWDCYPMMEPKVWVPAPSSIERTFCPRLLVTAVAFGTITSVVLATILMQRAPVLSMWIQCATSTSNNRKMFWVVGKIAKTRHVSFIFVPALNASSAVQSCDVVTVVTYLSFYLLRWRNKMSGHRQVGKENARLRNGIAN